MNVYKHWTPEDERQLVELYESGMKIKEIAANMGRTAGSLNARIASLGARGMINARGGPEPIPDTVKASVIAAYERGDTKQETAAALNMPLHTVVWIVHQHRKSLGLVRKQVKDTERSTGSSALDAAVDTLRKELEVLQLQQARIAEKITNLRRTIQHVQSITL